MNLFRNATHGLTLPSPFLPPPPPPSSFLPLPAWQRKSMCPLMLVVAFISVVSFFFVRLLFRFVSFLPFLHLSVRVG